MDFINSVLDATEQSEAPTSFYYWSALAAISAVVKSRVHISLYDGMLETVPNIYVLLIAKSGLRKGHPVSLAEKLVSRTNSTKVIAGRSSIQAIIQQLSKTRTTPNGGPPELNANGFIVNDEFSTSLVRDQDALTILTTLYDTHYHDTWTNTLKGGTGSGITETLKNPCITLLGALNQAHFQDMMTQKEIEGGFIARCLLIQEDRRSRINSGLRSSGKPFDFSRLHERLIEISHLSGRMTVSEAAIDIFDEWYNDWLPEEGEDKTGAANRVHTQILKVAMLLSLSRSDSLVIGVEEIKAAMQACHGHLQSAKNVANTGRSEDAWKASRVLDVLLKADENELSRQQVLKKLWPDVTAVDLDKISDTLDKMGAINIIHERGKSTYQLLPHVVEEYRRVRK